MIHLITPCTRPENLARMQQSIPAECTWTIVLDQSVKEVSNWSGLNAVVYQSPYTGHAGNPNRNFALDHMKFDDYDWIHVLDDDNIIHPEWYNRVKDFSDPALTMVSWGQVWQNNTVRLSPAPTPRVGNIDTSCYMVRGWVMKKERYDMDYVADGIMAERAYRYGNYLCLNEYLGYYNYLRTPPDRMA